MSITDKRNYFPFILLCFGTDHGIPHVNLEVTSHLPNPVIQKGH